MKTVNIAELKARLSAHIQRVRDGEEVLGCDHNKPVARIVPCRLEERSKQEQRLIADGLLTPPLNQRPRSVFWPEPPRNVPDEVLQKGMAGRAERTLARVRAFWDAMPLFPLRATKFDASYDFALREL